MSKAKIRRKAKAKSRKRKAKSKNTPFSGYDGLFYSGMRTEDAPTPLPPELPIRAELLNAARDLTLGDRNASYGDPLTNFEAIVALKRAFWDAARRDSPVCCLGAHMEQNTVWGHAMDMALMKLGRISSAPTKAAALGSDAYKDAINYLAIAYEVAQRTKP